MKKIIFLFFAVFFANSVCAQKELLDGFAKQVRDIDSLKKVIEAEKNSKLEVEQKYKFLLKSANDTNKILRSSLSKLDKFKKIEKTVSAQLKSKDDSIANLKASLSDVTGNLSAEQQRSHQAAANERDKCKAEISKLIIDSYKNNSLDNLIDFSSKDYLQRDNRIFNSSGDLQPISEELDRVFEATKSLSRRFDEIQAKNVVSELNKIKFKSEKVERLKELLDEYKAFNDGLKETIGKLIALDKVESAKNMPNEIKNAKYQKVLSEISLFIFNYNFQFADYPYLTGIIGELLKLKQPNPDADISKLSSKL